LLSPQRREISPLFPIKEGKEVKPLLGGLGWEERQLLNGVFKRGTAPRAGGWDTKQRLKAGRSGGKKSD